MPSCVGPSLVTEKEKRKLAEVLLVFTLPVYTRVLDTRQYQSRLQTYLRMGVVRVSVATVDCCQADQILSILSTF